MGASSGFGKELASLYSWEGHEVACASRRATDVALSASIDINSEAAPEQLLGLIDRLGGMDLYIHVSGIGYDDPELVPEREVAITETNCVGFARMVSTAFRWFEGHNRDGQIAAISSVAGTKGTAGLEAYCASKRYDWTYLQGLRQRAARNGYNITITDIRPGWTRTPLLKPGQPYPLLMEPKKASEQIMHAIARRRKVAYIDRRWQLLCMAWRMVPDWVWTSKFLQKKQFFRNFAG